MKIPVFLSYPKPHLKCQENFIKEIIAYLNKNNIETRTLGITDYDMNAPLNGIRRLMMDSNGILTIAFRRTFIEKGISKKDCEFDDSPNDLSGRWITSPYCQIEAAMAFQIGLPVLIFREKAVLDEGILQHGVIGTYMPEFDLASPDSYLEKPEWNQIVPQWISKVNNFSALKGEPLPHRFSFF